MEKEDSFKKVLSAAYAILARRPHAGRELEKKLLDKGFKTEAVSEVIEALIKKGFLNDYDVAYRWAQSRIKDRCWGRAKVYGFLKEKGISGNIISRVQEAVWEEFDEFEIARRAVNKRFSSASKPAQSKILSFLNSRGFSSGVIYRLTNRDDEG